MLVWLTTTVLTIAAVIQNKTFGWSTTALKVSDEELDIIKIVQSFKESGLLVKDVGETTKNEIKEQKADSFLCY